MTGVFLTLLIFALAWDSGDGPEHRFDVVYDQSTITGNPAAPTAPKLFTPSRTAVGESDSTNTNDLQDEASNESKGTIELIDFLSSQPVSGVPLILTGNGPDLQVTSDAAGHIYVPAGSWFITTTFPSFVIRPLSVAVTLDETAIVTLFQRQSLSIRVVDATNGVGVADTTLTLEPPLELDDHRAASTFDFNQTITAADGVAQFNSLPGLSSSFLSATAEGYEPLRISIPDARVYLSGENATAPLVISLKHASSKHPIHFQFQTSDGEPLPLVLLQAVMYFSERAWAGSDLAIVGSSNKSGKLVVRGDYRLASHFYCTGDRWPITVEGLNQEEQKSDQTVKVTIPARVPGSLRLPDAPNRARHLDVLILDRQAAEARPLQQKLTPLEFHPEVGPNGLASIKLPSDSPCTIIVSFPNGHQQEFEAPLVTEPGWVFDLNIEVDAAVPFVEIRCSTETLAKAVVRGRNRIKVEAPMDEAHSLMIPFATNARAIEVFTHSGLSAMLSFKGEHEALRSGTILEIDFTSGAKQNIELLFENGSPVPNCEVTFRPILASADFSSSQFAQQLIAGGSWGLRRGNTFRSTTDSKGRCSLKLPEGLYSFLVSTPTWTAAMTSWFADSAQNGGSVYFGSDSNTQTLFVRGNRPLDLDLAALDQKGLLPNRWFLRLGGGLEQTLGFEGTFAETTISNSSTTLEVLSEGGDRLYSFVIPKGTDKVLHTAE